MRTLFDVIKMTFASPIDMSAEALASIIRLGLDDKGIEEWEELEKDRLSDPRLERI
jgi:hypothetical protein